jgi:uncharacterized protein (TIGR02391 family)
MARKRASEQHAPVVKEFTADEIDRGIAKLKRRADEVKALQENYVSYDDAAVDNVENSISDAVLEIFGAESPEYQRYGHFRIESGFSIMGQSESESQAQFRASLPNAITRVEGLIAKLEEKRAELGIDPTTRARTAFQGMDFHVRISDVCSELYRDGHYPEAVFNASKALVNYVKERSGRHDLDGAALMRTVFSKNNPILAFNALADQTDLDEQEGMMHMFEGAVMAIRNPRGHSFLTDSPELALEYIALLSLLANRVGKAKRN